MATEQNARQPSTPHQPSSAAPVPIALAARGAELIGPVRTCVGCRQRAERSRLLRVVAERQGEGSVLLPDPRALRPGRGAWVHLDPGCFDQAVRRRAFVRALRVQGSLDTSAVGNHLQERLSTTGPTKNHPPSKTNRKRDIT